ncbi:PDR/VanB family oxidoreductase [Salipiger abyssi]|uniref:PDR/VanB family oxidoreductase n=1 Tax=Salipiger abyssi TaxID=1250539 RepID=UPI004059F09C
MTVQLNTGPDAPLSLTVTDKRIVARDIVELTLRNADHSALPDWRPGAHIDLLLGDALVRQYSLLGDCTDPTTWRVAILREPESRGGSVAAHKLEVGQPVDVRGPRNHFALSPSSRYLFIAGGIGITPLIPMLASAEKAGADWKLSYGGRSAETMAYGAELKALYGDRVTLYPQDEAGLLPLATLLGTPDEETRIYCCGPEALLSAVEAQTAGWPKGSLHVEHFTPKPVEDDIPDQPIEVVLAASGLTLHVPADRSILDMVTEAGIDVLTSCQEGTCGTCETVVLEGEPLHRDSVLTESEREAGETMMICVSRACGKKLVLDL